MKKIYSYLFAAVAIVAAVACKKEVTPQDEEKSSVEFIAEISETPTKVEIGAKDGDNYPVLWKSGDAIIINGSTFTTTGSGTSAVFTTTDTGFDGTASQFNAIYPATDGASFNNLTVPNVQTGSFEDACILVAQSTNTNLSFKHLGAILKFQVPYAASQITITSTKVIAGVCANVPFDANGNPAITATSIPTTYYNTITLSRAGGFVSGTDYFVGVFAQPGHKFTIHIDGELSKASTKELTTVRAEILNFGVLPPAKFADLGLVGQHQGWDLTPANLTPMYKVANKLYAAKNVQLQSSGFKFAKLNNEGNWSNTGGAYDANFKFDVSVGFGKWYKGVWSDNLSHHGNNVGVSDYTKSYDIYIKIAQEPEAKEYHYSIVETGNTPE